MLIVVALCIVLLVAVLLCLRPRLRALQRDDKRHVVLITGAAMGLGREVAKRCARSNDFVVALDANPTALRDLESELGGSEHALCLQVDVSDQVSLAAAAIKVQKRTGHSTPLDAVCNFAGVIRGGPLVEMDDEDLELVMNVNVGGTARANKVFFPLLRRGTGSSKIINVASEISLSWFSAAFTGPYAMSKVALEAYSTALRQELAFLDPPVHVVTLNPGAMRTPMVTDQAHGAYNSFFEASARREGTLFGPSLLKAAAFAANYMRRNSSEPEVVGEAVFSIIHSCAPLSRYVIGASFEMRYVMPLIPQWLLDFLIWRNYKP